ncbi:MAG: ECF transporter S component [Butyricicoccaceae bacterium]
MNSANRYRKSASMQIRKMTYAALYLAIAMVLPFLTGQIPEIGSMLCPMHIPALLCGFVCGWPWGLAVGFTAPLVRSVIFGMPTMFAAVAMAFEMGAYGAAAGILYRVLPKKKWAIYASLVCAMVLGRVVWGGAQYVLAGLRGTEFNASIFLAGAVTSAVPGIILHLVLIPIIVMTLERAGLILND